ncbi:MAG: addiction module protein [Bacteroidota bacterium]
MELQLSLDFNQLMRLIHKLPVKDKVKLAQALDEDLSDVIPEDHKKTVRNRIKDVKSGKKKLLKWEDIKNAFELE